MQRLIYTGAFRFPNLDAAATRVYNLAQLFNRQRFKISFASWESNTDKPQHYSLLDHDCYSMGEFREQPKNPAMRLIGFIFRGKRTLRWLYRHQPYDVVIAYNPPVFFSLGLFLLQRMQGFTLILDSTEWYESEHLPGGKHGLAAIENWIRMKWVYPRFKNVICISQFLMKHYAGRNTINIPPLLIEEPAPVPYQRLDSEVRFVYAGNAGRKDLLLPFIQALPSVEKRLGRKLTLSIAGLSWDELAIQMQSEGMNPNLFSGIVSCHGRLPKESIPDLYRKADFSILFREDKRYAHAGFPTKAVESWSMGCPIVLNEVGDIGKIAAHLEDSILVRLDHMEDDLLSSLKMALDSELLDKMRENCLLKAKSQFTTAAYSKAFEAFLENAGLGMVHSECTPCQ